MLIDTEECHIVLDAGNGFYKIDELIKDEKPIYVFLSHPHLDHISGLHTLNKYKFTQGIKIFGQPGTKDLLDRIISAALHGSVRSPALQGGGGRYGRRPP